MNIAGVKIKVEKDIAIIAKGKDTVVGKFIRSAGKITIKTPFGTRKITRIGVPGSKLAKEAEDMKAARMEKPKAVVKGTVKKGTVKRRGKGKKKK